MATVAPGPPTRDKIEAALGGAYVSLVALGQQGGQGAIYKAIAADGAVVALKVYNPDQVEERSEREVAALKKLKGDTIIRLHDAGELTIDGGQFRFLATTFIEGVSLADKIASSALDPVDVARIAEDVASALDELWSFRIVHRDVKPANIMVRPDGRAVLIDLGIARHLDQKAITTTGFILGTPGYFAPEYFGGRKVTCKADVFALGIVCQEMLLGRHPTRRQQKLLANGGPKTATMRSDTPKLLSQLIDKMVGKHPTDRPTPTKVATSIETFLRPAKEKQ
jgi:serine/threonine protein kinase